MGFARVWVNVHGVASRDNVVADAFGRIVRNRMAELRAGVFADGAPLRP